MMMKKLVIIINDGGDDGDDNDAEYGSVYARRSAERSDVINGGAETGGAPWPLGGGARADGEQPRTHDRPGSSTLLRKSPPATQEAAQGEKEEREV